MSAATQKFLFTSADTSTAMANVDNMLSTASPASASRARTTSSSCRSMLGKVTVVSALLASIAIDSCMAFSASPPLRQPAATASATRLSVHPDIAGATNLLSAVPTAVAHSYNACLLAHKLPTQACTGGLFALLGDGLAQYQTSPDREIDPKRSSTYLFKGCVGGIIWASWYAALDPVSAEWAKHVAEAWQGAVGSAAPAATASAVDSVGETVASSFDAAQAEALWQAQDLMTMSDDVVADMASTVASAPVAEAATLDDPTVANIQRVTNTILCVALEQFFACPIIYALWDIPLPAYASGTPTRALPTIVEQKMGPLLVANAKVWTPVNMITYNLPLDFRLPFISFIEIIWQSINARITSEPEAMENSTTDNNAMSTSQQRNKDEQSSRERRISV